MSGTIVVIEERTTNRIIMMSRLEAARYDAVTAADGATGLGLLNRLAPDLVLISKDLPDMTGLSVMSVMRRNPALRSVPVIMLLDNDDPAERLALLRAGADDALCRSVDPNWLLARGRALMRSYTESNQLRRREAELATGGVGESGEGFDRSGLTAVIADSPAKADQCLLALAPHYARQLVAMPVEQALASAQGRAGTVDAFLLIGTAGNGEAALRLMSDLKTRGAAPGAAFCLLLGDACRSPSITAFNMDAQEVLDPACPPDELAFRLDRMVRRKKCDDRRRAAIDQSAKLSVIDYLTQTYTRRHGEAQLDRLVADCRNGRRGLVVMVVDLDLFKSVNDGWGHAAGDAVLAEVARRLKSTLGPLDVLARIGGEEFLIAIPDCDVDRASAIAGRLCTAIHDRPVATASGHTIPVTVSIGWSLLCPHRPDESRTTMTERADQALLQAKAAGRNRVRENRAAA